MSRASEPIAIVGIACRFPGANDIESFWRLLEEGGNAVTERAAGSGEGRWGMLFGDESHHSEGCRFGAFVDDIEDFDESFFRISPVEAKLLDPQQRMALEVSWQALEDAGIDPATLRESRTGVYMGISNDEYRMLVVESEKPADAASCLYALSGTNLNGTAGRVSFNLGLRGPCKAVDAACASAMVAINDAVADLQQGKASLAIAGGVQAILNGRIYELRADAMMLSPAGQCKTFDASADGYVRAEGCGVVVLKRLEEAERDGDRIWAVIRSSVVNHGGTGVGLTVPNTPALEEVMRDALAAAGIDPLDVDYVEAHGTGTAVGDPIEIDAVSGVYCRGRAADRPLLIGSVKTNVGHLESAAGVVSLIKAALAVRRGVIPKHLHFRSPNPAIEWDGLPLRVTASTTEWPRRTGGPRVAGVNCFGISGTNAHALVEEYEGPEGARPAVPGAGSADVPKPLGAPRAVPVSLPSAPQRTPPPRGAVRSRGARMLPLSARSGPALRELAGRYLAWLDEQAAERSAGGTPPQSLLADAAWTASVGRSHFGRRAGVVFRDAASLRDALGAVAGATGGREAKAPARVAFAYTGQGSQWTGMGRALHESEPVARAILDRCEEVFREVRGTSLLDVMFGGAGAAGDLGDTAWEQPALYALECALTALWSSVGVRPDVVLGHSVGEIAAAQAAGVFGLADGMRFACARGSLMSGMEAGAMAAVFAPPERVAAEVEAFNAASSGVPVGISGDNGTHQVVSGPAAGVEAISERFDSDSVRVVRLNTAKAFHSALADPILDDLEASLDGVAVERPGVTFVSNLTGCAVESGRLLDGAYWRRHAREAVAFASGIRTLADSGVDVIVEIGPRSVLAPMALAAWPESSRTPSPRVLATLAGPPGEGAGEGGGGDFAAAAAGAYEAGLPIRPEALFAGESRRRISLPGYPFQRTRHWLEAPKRRRGGAGHPLLGLRHDSAGGEVAFESELFAADPQWLEDHRVFGRVVVPGALYGAMAASASALLRGGPVVVEDVQLHSALVFPKSAEDEDEGRTIQLVLDAPDQASSRRFRIYSRASGGDWTAHVEGRLPPGGSARGPAGRIDLEELGARLSPADAAGYYRARAESGVGLGPFFQTLRGLRSGPGEALGEVSLPEGAGGSGLDLHPLVLDGPHGGVTYLPFGWERFSLTTGQLPQRVFCHVRMSEASREAESRPGEPPEVLTGEMRICDPDGLLLGVVGGYAVKRATRASLLSAGEGVGDLLYEVVWRECALADGMPPADFFPAPGTVKAGAQPWSEYLAEAGVDRDDRNALLRDLEEWSWSYALKTLDRLGWERVPGAVVHSEELRERLGVLAEHGRLFRRMLEMATRAGALREEEDGNFVVELGSGDPWPSHLSADLDGHAAVMLGRYAHGQTETGLFRRSAAALPEVLRGREDPLTLLFSSGEPTAADLYLKAPVARAANRMLEVAVRALVDALPRGRRLRVIEVGAGTGSATASILPVLPDGQFEYMYTDISAGFFAEAEARFGDGGGCIDYRPLDIEKDPVAQGFDLHGYDLIIASNVLHATRSLDETLDHCRLLLAPSGQLVALENLSGLGWMDLTFGQLDGWWRFADDYRPRHALASPAVWRQALGNAGFEEVEVLGADEVGAAAVHDKGVIVAQGPARVTESPGSWVVAGGASGLSAAWAARLAGDLRARNQTVVLARPEGADAGRPDAISPDAATAVVEMRRRESWRSLVDGLPAGVPFRGVVHFAALDGAGEEAAAEEMWRDVTRAGESALAMVQGVGDAGATPERGLWFVTSGAQVLERERGGSLAGAALWGFGKGVEREAAHLKPRMLELDPAPAAPAPDLANELMYPDLENHVAYRRGRRTVARLVRTADGAPRLALPDEAGWVLAPDPDGVFDRPYVQQLTERALDPREVRVEVEAAGLNFWDVFRSLGFIEEGLLGREMCGRIAQVGAEVSNVSVGDHVVGMGFGAFGPDMITHEELVAPAPGGISTTGLATIPSAFVSAALSFEFTGLQPGERVLVHAAAGGVGLAAVQLVHAAGADVFATASAPKRDYVRSLGVRHIFDSRTTDFGEEIMEATSGEGVDVVLNSLTSEGFIDASLACLKPGGRFVEMARRDILSYEEMAAARPDVAYHILELDVVKKTDPERAGRVLRDVMERVSAGDLEPIVHSRWPLAEAGTALSFMRSARHLGKIVVSAPPVVGGRLRRDRTYLVTGGLGGIGCAVAEWMAERGAGAIVLNGRRGPDADAEGTIRALRDRGVTVRVELADVTDTGAVDRMLARIDRSLPPLGGVVHSVGVLSDGALTNQSWERFERVLAPKILGAWHLHRATLDRDLDMFVLFSSRVGVMGNPGQTNHGAANAFLDQLAGHRRALGLAGQAIAWGAWSEIGEAAEQRERIDRRRSALGGRWFTPQQGIRAFDRLVRQDATSAVVMAMDWAVFEEAVEQRPPLLEELLAATEETEAESAASSQDVLTRLRQAPSGERGDVLVSFLQGEVQAVLRLPSAPSPTVGFFDLGMDSLMAVELRNRLNRAFTGTYTAPNTLVFDYPDIVTLAGHLAEELEEDGAPPVAEPEPEPVAAPDPAEQPREDGIGIVGMACRFPGAPDLDAYWRLLESGADMVTDGRRDAGPWRGVDGDPEAAGDARHRGAYLEGLDKFDARFFGIHPIEARSMDPRQRLLLETTWHALEDAGVDPETLRGSRTGVYTGVGDGDYKDLALAAGHALGYLGGTVSVTAGRISFALGLNGPAVPVDLACASSLAAVHQAVSALQRGEVETALVGGVHAVISADITHFLGQSGMLSATGRCSSFDAAADGFVRGEGCGVLVLKRLDDARADGDRIWGIVRGSAVNHNGSAAALTVPNGPAQERVIEEALSRAGVSPSEVDYLEANSVGSDLGDPIEVQAAAAVYGRGRDPESPLLIGSVKTNIGHLESASGVAGLIKTVLAMNEGRIPKQLHFRDPNPHVDWDRLPVRVTPEATKWPARPDRPPRAAVSAFGLSGANAHVVVEGAPAVGGTRPAGAARTVDVRLPERTGAFCDTLGEFGRREARVLPLSGKSRQALRELAGRYLAWLEPIGDADRGAAAEPRLDDMAWTAGTGRSHFAHRAGIVFRDLESLRAALGAVAGAEVDGSGSYDRGSGTSPRVASVYTGEGSEQNGMGQELYDREPVVRAVLDRCDAVIREEREGASLLDVMFGREGAGGRLRDPEWAHPGLYSVQCALTALWESVGVRPGVAVGDGTGELAAAWAAGIFSLDDGLRIAAARGTAMAQPKARMAAAAPASGGATAARQDGLAELEVAIAGVDTRAPSLTLINLGEGQAMDSGQAPDPARWLEPRQARGLPGRCKDRLAELNVQLVLEIGAGPTADPVRLDSWPETAVECDAEFAESVARAYEAGLPVSFAGLFAGERRRRISLPGYPFERRRHWIE
ncbi:MAG: SDR family NAD(P)-dependent oxidoreductase [Gemmatimonadota bacterium]|nr:SDR family NAD(P)-dependent oxidoreductase [Gemmatimonadota bacterium]